MRNCTKKLRVFLLVLIMLVSSMAVVFAENLETKEVMSMLDKIDLSQYAGKRIAFISGANQFDFYVYMGAKQNQIAEQYGIKMTNFDAKADLAIEVDLMTQIISQGFDAIIAVPLDTVGFVPSIEEANEAGVPVVEYDSFMDADVYARVGSSNRELGRQAAEYTVEFLKEKYGEPKGTITILAHMAFETMAERSTGFEDYMAQYPNIIVTVEKCKDSLAEIGQTVSENLLIANNKEGSMDVLYGTNAGLALGAYAAVAASGREDVVVVGIDDELGELDAIAEGGAFKATVAQDSITMGEYNLKAACNAIGGNRSGDIVIPGVLVTSENITEYREADSRRKAELEQYK